MFEWQIAEDEWQTAEDEEWERFDELPESPVFPPAPDPAAPPQRRARKILLTLVLSTCLALSLVGYLLWRQDQVKMAHIRASIQHTIDLEAWAWHTDNAGMTEHLLNPQETGRWALQFRELRRWTRYLAGDEASLPAVTIQKVELHEDLALVETTMAQHGLPWAAAPYRQTRFYRQVANRWLRTAPVPASWGARRMTETAHFRFEYRQRDAAAVAAAAPQIETLYARLRQDAGLGAPLSDEKLVVRVEVPSLPLADVLDWDSGQGPFSLPTPALLPVPVGLSDEAVLVHTMRYPLTRYVLNEAFAKNKWPVLAKGLQVWLSREDNELPSTRQFLRARSVQKWPKTPNLYLSDLKVYQNARSVEYTQHAGGPSGHWERTVEAGAVKLIQYAVTTYGRAKLPALVAGMGRHATWETLIPAVFGIPAAEFEAGWQAHLDAQ